MTSYNTSSKPFYISLSFLVLLILTIAIVAYFAVIEGKVPSLIKEPDQGEQFLIDTNPQATSDDPVKDISFLILMLIAGFGILQIIPVLIAALKTKKGRLTSGVIKEIIFLCETPMYLGLLGSLVGVCLTQFMTGTLSAPLAYITTITGILLHLFAKFTIIVPLPGSATHNTTEEV